MKHESFRRKQKTQHVHCQGFQGAACSGARLCPTGPPVTAVRCDRAADWQAPGQGPLSPPPRQGQDSAAAAARRLLHPPPRSAFRISTQGLAAPTAGGCAMSTAGPLRDRRHQRGQASAAAGPNGRSSGQRPRHEDPHLRQRRTVPASAFLFSTAA